MSALIKDLVITWKPENKWTDEYWKQMIITTVRYNAEYTEHILK